MRSLSVIPALLFSLAASMEARAVAVSLSDLPQTVQQTCTVASNCFVNLSSSYNSGAVSAFAYLDSQIPENSGWLVRYELGPNSSQGTYSQYDNNSMVINQTDVLSGYLWVKAPSYVELSAALELTIYRDKVTPTPGNLFGQNDPVFTPYADLNGDLTFSLPGTDLVDFSGTHRYIQTTPGVATDEGNLSGELPVACLVDCFVSVDINLGHLVYEYTDEAQTALQMVGLNPFPNEVVFSQEWNFYPNAGLNGGESTLQTFAISAVPEPGILAMLGCGLGMVAFVARRRRT